MFFLYQQLIATKKFFLVKISASCFFVLFKDLMKFHKTKCYFRRLISFHVRGFCSRNCAPQNFVIFQDLVFMVKFPKLGNIASQLTISKIWIPLSDTRICVGTRLRMVWNWLQLIKPINHSWNNQEETNQK